RGPFGPCVAERRRQRNIGTARDGNASTGAGIMIISQSQTPRQVTAWKSPAAPSTRSSLSLAPVPGRSLSPDRSNSERQVIILVRLAAVLTIAEPLAHLVMKLFRSRDEDG